MKAPDMFGSLIAVGITSMVGLQAIIRAPIMATWAITKIAGKSFEWTLATGVALIILTIMILILVLIALPKFKNREILDNIIYLGIRAKTDYLLKKAMTEDKAERKNKNNERSI